MKISFFIIQCERTAVAKKNFLVTKRSKKSYCLKVTKIIISKNLVWHSRWEWIDFFFWYKEEREEKRSKNGKVTQQPYDIQEKDYIPWGVVYRHNNNGMSMDNWIYVSMVSKYCDLQHCWNRNLCAQQKK